MRRWVFGKLVYPLAVMLRGEGGVFRIQRRIEEMQWTSQDAIRTFQKDRLHRLLKHATTAVPAYHSSAGASAPDDADAFEALRSLPLLSKARLQRTGDELRAHGSFRVTRKTTGGSTGQAVTVQKERAAIASEMAATWVGYGWFGVRPGDRAVRFWGDPATVRRKLRFAAADFVMNRKRFSAFAFNEQTLERYWAATQRFGPDYLYGYVSMLEQLGRYVLKNNLRSDGLRLKAVITTSEVLTEAHRKLFADAFGAPVQNEYGCGEVGPIAYECPNGSLHVMATNLVVEILDREGNEVSPGESGEVVVTDLNNYAMPLIRYRVGDYAERGADCTCGRGFPVLARIRGREYDFIQGPDGSRYHGEYIMYLFEDLRAAGIQIDGFKVTQVEEAELLIELVSDEPHEAVTERVRTAFSGRLPRFAIHVAFVPEIPRRPSGKAVLVENRLAAVHAERYMQG